MSDQTFLAIDLKSFYASAECASLGLDPLNTNLVVADESRTEKTICLAVSPALKAFGVPGRPRLFEVNQAVRQLNRERTQAVGHSLSKQKSIYRDQLLHNPNLRLSYQIVPPRMQYYLNLSAEIYEIYLRYLEPDHIHVYSIDEVFIDITDYLKAHPVSAVELAKEIILTIQAETSITATAGIGTNMFLAKVALDIMAKKIPTDADGVRIAHLDELSYRQLLWAHQPLTDFWRVGRGYARRLKKLGLNTMGDIARASIGTLSDPLNAEVLYREFGKNAELLIDHAWGFESATIKDIKQYRASDHGIYSGQVLPKPYPIPAARLVVSEMADDLALQLIKQQSLTDQITLHLSYDAQSLNQPFFDYAGPVSQDFYGRQVPKSAHGSQKLSDLTTSSRELKAAFDELFDEIVNPKLLIRKVTVIANHLVTEADLAKIQRTQQLDLFSDPDQIAHQAQQDQSHRNQDKNVQETILKIQNEFGKNALIKAGDMLEDATARKRHNEIGGHQA